VSDDDQLTLFGEDGVVPHAHARRTDPATSHEAAASIVSDKIRASQDAVLKILARYGPLTDERIAEVYRLHGESMRLPAQSPSGLRTRRKELVDRGLVVDSGGSARSASGRRVIIWRRV